VTGQTWVDKDAYSLKSALVGRPVTASVYADGLEQFFNGGVIDTGCQGSVDHAVIAVGYGTDNGVDYFKIRNSWGKSWGEDGYVRLAANGNTACLFNWQGSYPEISGGPAPGPSPAPWASLQSTASGLCLDLPDGDTTNGNLLWVWDCYGGEPQQWAFQDNQLVYLPDTSKCVDLIGGDTTNGNRLAIWDCYGGESQQWGFDSDYGTMYLASSGHDASKCGFSESYQGGIVAIWDCNSDEETQIWTVGTGIAFEAVV